ARGISSFDRIPDFRKERYEAPAEDDLRSLMRATSDTNKSSHPSLKGMEFDADDVMHAVAAVHEADESIFVSDHHGTPKNPRSTLVERLIASDDFKNASRDKDLSNQMRVCLEEMTFDIWAYNYTTRHAADPAEIERVVRQDISDARHAIAEIGKVPVDPNNYLTSMLHDRLARFGGSPFIEAMYILLQHRCSPVSSPPVEPAGAAPPETTLELDIQDLEIDASDSSGNTGMLGDPNAVEAIPEIISGEIEILDQAIKSSSDSDTASGTCNHKPRKKKHARELRTELRVDVDRLISLIDLISDDKRHLLADAMPVAEWLLYECSESDASGMRLRMSKITDDIPELYPDDPQKERAIEYLVDLTSAINSY